MTCECESCKRGHNGRDGNGYQPCASHGGRAVPAFEPVPSRTALGNPPTMQDVTGRNTPKPVGPQNVTFAEDPSPTGWCLFGCFVAVFMLGVAAGAAICGA